MKGVPNGTGPVTAALLAATPKMSTGTVRGSTSTGTSTSSAGPGLGLIGMRERVAALGGRLHAAPRDGGGFQVRAEFPARAPS